MEEQECSAEALHHARAQGGQDDVCCQVGGKLAVLVQKKEANVVTAFELLP